MPNGYNPIQFVPKYGGIAEAGKLIGAGMAATAEKFSDLKEAAKKMEENKALAGIIWKSYNNTYKKLAQKYVNAGLMKQDEIIKIINTALPKPNKYRDNYEGYLGLLASGVTNLNAIFTDKDTELKRSKIMGIEKAAMGAITPTTETTVPFPERGQIGPQPEGAVPPISPEEEAQKGFPGPIAPGAEVTEEVPAEATTPAELFGAVPSATGAEIEETAAMRGLRERQKVAAPIEKEQRAKELLKDKFEWDKKLAITKANLKRRSTNILKASQTDLKQARADRVSLLGKEAQNKNLIKALESAIKKAPTGVIDQIMYQQAREAGYIGPADLPSIEAALLQAQDMGDRIGGYTIEIDEQIKQILKSPKGRYEETAAVGAKVAEKRTELSERKDVERAGIASEPMSKETGKLNIDNPKVKEALRTINPDTGAIYTVEEIIVYFSKG